MSTKKAIQARLFEGLPPMSSLRRSATDQLKELAVWGYVRFSAELSAEEGDLWLAYMANRLVQHGQILTGSMNVFLMQAAPGEPSPVDKQVLVDILSEQPLVSSFEVGEPVPLVDLATGAVPVGFKPTERLTQEDALVFQALVLRQCAITLSLAPGRPSAHHAAFMHLMYP